MRCSGCRSIDRRVADADTAHVNMDRANGGCRNIEYLDHTADAAVRVHGATAEAVFERAAEGMFSLMLDRDSVKRADRVSIHCEAPTVPELLVEWLARLLAERDIRGIALASFDVAIDRRNEACTLDAVAWGERMDPSRHGLATEVKGISLLGLRAEERADGWVAQCVFDV